MTAAIPKHTPVQFGIAYGFIVDATQEGVITLNAKALAKIEPGGADVMSALVKRANSQPDLLAALQAIESALQYAMSEDADSLDFDGCATLRDQARAAIERATK